MSSALVQVVYLDTGGGTTVAFFEIFISTSTSHPGRAPTLVEKSRHTSITVKSLFSQSAPKRHVSGS
jgi:hypothetical protein